MQRNAKPVHRPHLNAESDRSDWGTSDTRLLSIVSTFSDASDPMVKGMTPSS
jgi:hypothetical protein